MTTDTKPLFPALESTEELKSIMYSRGRDDERARVLSLIDYYYHAFPSAQTLLTRLKEGVEIGTQRILGTY